MKKLRYVFCVVSLCLLFEFHFKGQCWANPDGQDQSDQSISNSQIGLSFLGMGSSLGVEGNTTWLFQPILDRGFRVGPRVDVLWVGNSSQGRLEFGAGVDAQLWMVNAVGIGFGTDVLVPGWVSGLNDSTQRSVHVRFNPSLAIRVLRFEDDGAWAMRMGLLYDTVYNWGFQLGASLQFSGVR